MDSTVAAAAFVAAPLIIGALVAGWVTIYKTLKEVRAATTVETPSGKTVTIAQAVIDVQRDVADAANLTLIQADEHRAQFDSQNVVIAKIGAQSDRIELQGDGHFTALLEQVLALSEAALAKDPDNDLLQRAVVAAQRQLTEKRAADAATAKVSH